jgi:hypothetical protein
VSAYVDEYRERFGVEPICRVLDVSASAYYERRKGERAARAIEDERLLSVIEHTHARNHYAYGYRRMWKAMLRAGETVGRDRVKRIMREAGIQGAKRRGRPWRTTRPDPRAMRSPDLVERDFTADRPDRLWVADLTYLRCFEGLVFFAFVIDVFSRAGSWAGSSPATCAQVSSPMPCGWHCSAARRAPTSSSSTTAMPAANTPRSTSPRRSQTTGSCSRSALSATPTTTPRPRASSTASRPS